MVSQEELHRALERYFGHRSFRPGQLPIVRSVLSGQPTLAVMPTGAGKSLCFQLPAMLLPGPTLVISPLVALMKDQVDALAARGLPAACIHGGQAEDERLETERAFSQGKLRLLYVAPERLRNPSFQTALRSSPPLELLAVDEAHCISEWGHSFRPDYQKLGDFVETHRPKRLVAMTATATPDVRSDIVRALRMRNPTVAVAGFDRPNIHLEIHRLKSDAEKRDTLEHAVQQHSPAIVYTATRRQTEATARLLGRTGMNAVAYHAGMATAERERLQNRFASGDADVVVATNAFGLGIDKADVRLVVHMELPRSLEAYYQEIGRAGRDGQPATGLMLFAFKDQWFQRRLLKLANPHPRAVAEVLERLREAPRPLTSNELDRSSSRLEPVEITASLRFLEGLGIVERQHLPGPLRLRISKNVDPAGDGAASVLARRLGGLVGELSTNEAMTALGAASEDELVATLGQLRMEKLVKELRSPPLTVYTLKSDATLTHDDLRRLRVRSFRDRGRLQQMLLLAHRNSCRRHALLRALGESQPPNRCQACDVCMGPVIAPVRSRLPLALTRTRRKGATRQSSGSGDSPA